MISSRQNRWVKDIRRLRRSKAAREVATDGAKVDVFLLEGPHLLVEALGETLAPPFDPSADESTGADRSADDRLELRAVLATPRFLASAEGRGVCARLPRPPLEIDPALLDELSDADSPRGILALAARRARTLDDLPVPSRPDPIWVYADGLGDPGNLGALARVAEAAGAEALLTSPGSVDPYHPRALRASAGSLLRLPVVAGVRWQSLERQLERQLERLFEEGRAPEPERVGGQPPVAPSPTWAGLLTRGGRSLWEAGPEGSRVLAVGAEAAGLSPELEARLDHGLTIPMSGRVESLNATVAASVVLYEWARRRGSRAQSCE